MIRVTLSRPGDVTFLGFKAGPGTVSHVGQTLTVAVDLVYLDDRRIARRARVKADPPRDDDEEWLDEHGAHWTMISIAAVDAKEVRWK